MPEITELQVGGYVPERDHLEVSRNLIHADMYRENQDNPRQLAHFVEQLPTAVIVGRFPGCDRVEASMYIPDSHIPLLARYALHPIYDDYPEHADMVTATMYNAAFAVLRQRGAPHVEDLYDLNGLPPSTWENLGFDSRYRLLGMQQDLWGPAGTPKPAIGLPGESGFVVSNYDPLRDGAAVQQNMQAAQMYVEGQDNPERMADMVRRTPDAVIVARATDRPDVVAGSLSVSNSAIPLVARYVTHPYYKVDSVEEYQLACALHNAACDILRRRGAPHIEALYDQGMRAILWRRLGFAQKYHIIGVQRDLWLSDGSPAPDIPIYRGEGQPPHWDAWHQPVSVVAPA